MVYVSNNTGLIRLKFKNVFFKQQLQLLGHFSVYISSTVFLINNQKSLVNKAIHIYEYLINSIFSEISNILSKLLKKYCLFKK